MSEAVIENAPAVEAPPAVEASWGAGLMDFGLDEVSTDAPPLPTDAAQQAGEEKKADVAASDQGEAPAPKAPEGEKPKQDAVPDAAAKPPAPEPAKDAAVEAKPAVEDDPELTAEDNELIRTRPAIEQPILKDRLKKASFFSIYKDPEQPAEGTRQQLETISPSSYQRLEGAIVDKRLSDPAAFADDLFIQNKETYGKLAVEIFKGSPEYFVEQITGKQLPVKTVKAAVDFYEANKDRNFDAPAGVAVPDEIIDQVRLYVGNEAADLIAKLRGGAPEAAAEQIKNLQTKVTELETAAKPKEETKEELAAKEKRQLAEADAQKAIQTEEKEVWDAASGQIENYLGEWADDAKDGLGLKVTPQERELAPDVADLKDFKREVLFNGMGDLPDFREGLTEWGKTREPFVKALQQAVYFAEHREKDNAIEAARALLPFVEKYKQERLQSPIFARIDNLIRIASAKTNPKVEAETFIPGAPGPSSQSGESSDPEKRIVDLLLNDAQGK